jgi:3-hydroxybutyrate dehydrogenase
MVFGEAEWQTSRMIESQVNVNLIGTIKMTHAMLPLARHHRARIINVTSHCGIQCLPTLAVYGATKAGLASFTECLRMEMQPHGVDVVNFIPGSFMRSSNLASAQLKHTSDMRAAFSEEQRSYYGDFFDRMSLYLSAVGGERTPAVIDDANILRTFEEALLEVPARPRYICEPWRYKWYHLLFRVAPTSVRDWLVRRFVMLPQFEKKAIGN